MVITYCVLSAGNDTALTLCTYAPPEDLFALLGDALPGGTWSGPSTVVAGMFDPATMEAGTYTYTIPGIGSCPDDNATVTVVLDPCTGIGEHVTDDAIRWLGQEADGTHVLEASLAVVEAWEVLDAAGRVLLQGGSPVPQQRLRIPMGTRPSGVHVVRLRTGQGMTALRLVHVAR